jgi:hypothetical protein
MKRRGGGKRRYPRSAGSPGLERRSPWGTSEAAKSGRDVTAVAVYAPGEELVPEDDWSAAEQALAAVILYEEKLGEDLRSALGKVEGRPAYYRPRSSDCLSDLVVKMVLALADKSVGGKKKLHRVWRSLPKRIEHGVVLREPPGRKPTLLWNEQAALRKAYDQLRLALKSGDATPESVRALLVAAKLWPCENAGTFDTEVASILEQMRGGGRQTFRARGLKAARGLKEPYEAAREMLAPWYGLSVHWVDKQLKSWAGRRRKAGQPTRP